MSPNKPDPRASPCPLALFGRDHYITYIYPPFAWLSRKILSIVYIILVALGALIFFIVGGVMTAAAGDPSILAEANVTAEDAAAAAVAMFFLGGYVLVGLVPAIGCLVLSNRHPKPSKAAIIVWGIIALAFADWILGILMIVWGCKDDAE